MNEETVIELQDLVKRYPMGTGEFTALKGISFNLKKGEFAGLVGPSGSGKTTVLNIIGTLDSPSGGEAKVLGRPVSALSAKQAALLRRSKIGFIFQTYNLFPVYNAYENVEFPLILMGWPATERKKSVWRALEWVGLADKAKSRPAQLSGGESQRVAIARAMVKQPELVLADEPTANLDAENSHNVLRTMAQLNEELRTTFLFATHDEKVIQYLRRKIHLLDGRVAEDKEVVPQYDGGTRK